MRQINQKETDSFRDDLNSMYRNRICSAFPVVSKDDIKKSGIIVYGIASFGKYVINGLLRHDINARFIIDRNEALHGSDYHGIPIRSVSDLRLSDSSYVMIASTHVKEMVVECEKYNVNKWILPASIRAWCPLLVEIGICNDSERQEDNLVSAYALMNDQKSRDIFRAYVKYHHVFDNDFSKFNDPIQFFPDDLSKRIDYSFFIDAGAFTGDTLNDWIKMFKPEWKTFSYFAFEPGQSSYEELREKVSNLQGSLSEFIHVIHCALGNEEGMISMVGQNESARVQSLTKSGDTPCKRLDDLFANENPTIIKADVEGAEMDLLLGAEKLIRRCRPTLAISVYHKYSDIWKIPEWINGLDVGYELYLRHHPKVFTDTVCYAIAR